MFEDAAAQLGDEAKERPGDECVAGKLCAQNL